MPEGSPWGMHPVCGPLSHSWSQSEVWGAEHRRPASASKAGGSGEGCPAALHGQTSSCVRRGLGAGQQRIPTWQARC